MTYTLAQHLKIERDPEVKYVISKLLRDIKVMEYLTFEEVTNLHSVAARLSSLPDVEFRAINDGYSKSVADFDFIWETVYILGGDFEYDRVFEKFTNTIIPMDRAQMDAKLKALAIEWNNYFINGDHATDALGFEGLKKRVASMPSRQTVYFAGSSSAPLDPTASAANGRYYLKSLREMHKRCNDRGTAIWLANEGQVLGLGEVLTYLQVSGGNILDVTRDTFGREVVTAFDAPFIDVGLKKDRSTEIIPDTETAGDGGADSTSIYAVALGTEEGVVGIQRGGLEYYDPLAGGEQEDKPAKLKRLEWINGIASFGSYGIVRGRNIEAADDWT